MTIAEGLLLPILVHRIRCKDLQQGLVISSKYELATKEIRVILGDEDDTKNLLLDMAVISF